MTESSYVLDNDWVYERERFDAIERNLDPGTIWALTEIGVSNGWNCLEVGAGGGSVTEWLCKPVGSDGQVTAIDSLLESRGVDRFYGRVLYSKLNSFGLTRVKANGRSVTLQGDRIKRDGSYNGAVADSVGR